MPRAPPNRVLVAVISHKRPENVRPTTALLDGRWRVVWIVGRGESAAYKAHGATEVVEGGNLCQSRNFAIKLAKEARCSHVVEMSDDLKGIRHIQCGVMSVESAAKALIAAMRATNLKLAGAYPVTNERWAKKAAPFSFYNFVVGDFIVIDTASPVRFDERFRVKEDYDFTMAHIRQHGGVLRANHLLVYAAHRTNRGGVCSPDRAHCEQEAIHRLQAKWGETIREHPRRCLEVVLRLPNAQKRAFFAESARLASHPWSVLLKDRDCI